ncbi:MAG: N-acetylmuramoyl-L-alanine amidase [Lachnospiraceae bacterium]|nr:N-acetylmuramoyl-L-alanine amidase [Lachnospiraceae bacterium]
MAPNITEGWIPDAADGLVPDHSIPCDPSNYQKNAGRSVSYVVMHYTGNAKDTAQANANYFHGAGRKASAHFFVDENSIYQSVALHDAAWHCGAKQYKHPDCRNGNSIGIEMCTSGNARIADTTKEHAAHLCVCICRRLGITRDQVDTYVLRHYDVTGKLCPAQMVSEPHEWTAFKERVKAIMG